MNKFNRIAIFPALLIICICFLFSPVNAFTDTGDSPAVQAVKEYKDDTISKYPSINDSQALASYRTAKGFRNMAPFSSALIEQGIIAIKEGRERNAIKFFKDAITVSPDMPQSYIYMSKATFSLSSEGITASIGYLFSAWQALERNIWWSCRAAGIFMSSIYISLYLSVAALFFVYIYSGFNLYIHDVMENAKKVFLLVPAIILLFIGPIFSLFAFILPFWAYLKEKEKGLVYGIFIAVFAVIITLPFHTTFVNAYSDPNLREIVNVNSGLFTGDRTYSLRDSDDYESVFTLALSRKRMGDFHEAINLYKTLLGKGTDDIIFNNIANCYVGLADYKKATIYYNKSLEISELASAYYNLSQLNREVFNFKVADKYYSDALHIDAAKVATFASLRGDSAGSSVVDEVLEIDQLWSVIIKRSSSDTSLGLTGRLYSFHNRGVSVILLLFLAVCMTVYGTMVDDSAYRCSKCGRIFCENCEEKSLINDVCQGCYRTISDKFLLKPKERTARTIEMRRYKNSRTMLFKIISLLLPGGGHIFHGNTFVGFIMLFMFFMFLVSGVLWTFFLPAESMTIMASAVKKISFAGLVVIYGFVIYSVLREGV